MTPLICFYDEGRYIYSVSYQLISCEAQQDVQEFLNTVNHDYPGLKVVQVNFDAFHAETKAPKLYTGKKALVYVLNEFKIVTENELAQKIKLSNNSDELPEFELLTSKKEFIEKVDEIKTMIARGRFYQVNLTSAFKAVSTDDDLILLKKLWSRYNGQYKAFLPFKDYSILSFSPELFLEKKGNTLRTQPIKGSSRPDADGNVILIESEKEHAELSMIVDLLRNDLNGLEESNSAVVTKHREVMKLNYIYHTFSEIEIQTEKKLPTILGHMMPGGSISGCPKKESLLAIAELETYQRQAYTGCLGWWDQSDFSLNITIRSFIKSQSDLFYFAGCGIVYDSNSENEFQELLNKAGVLNVRHD